MKTLMHRKLLPIAAAVMIGMATSGGATLARGGGGFGGGHVGGFGGAHIGGLAGPHFGGFGGAHMGGLNVALLILGSVATSASAAGSDIHGLVDAQTGHTAISEETSNNPPIGGYQNALRHAGHYSGRGAAGLGHW